MSSDPGKREQTQLSGPQLLPAGPPLIGQPADLDVLQCDDTELLSAMADDIRLSESTLQAARRFEDGFDDFFRQLKSQLPAPALVHERPPLALPMATWHQVSHILDACWRHSGDIVHWLGFLGARLAELARVLPAPRIFLMDRCTGELSSFSPDGEPYVALARQILQGELRGSASAVESADAHDLVAGPVRPDPALPEVAWVVYTVVDVEHRGRCLFLYPCAVPVHGAEVHRELRAFCLALPHIQANVRARWTCGRQIADIAQILQRPIADAGPRFHIWRAVVEGKYTPVGTLHHEGRLFLFLLSNDSSAQDIFRLSELEREMAFYRSLGCRYREIARAMDTSLELTHTILCRALCKLNVHSQETLVHLQEVQWHACGMARHTPGSVAVLYTEGERS